MNSIKVVCITHTLVQNIILSHMIALREEHTEICFYSSIILLSSELQPDNWVQISEQIIFQWADSFQQTISFRLNDLFMSQSSTLWLSDPVCVYSSLEGMIMWIRG